MKYAALLLALGLAAPAGAQDLVADAAFDYQWDCDPAGGQDLCPAPQQIWVSAMGTTCGIQSCPVDGIDDNQTAVWRELHYKWDFGDTPRVWQTTGASTQFEYGAIANHVYVEGGTYTITLTVTDHTGFKDTAQLTVHVDGIDEYGTAAQTYCARRSGAAFGSDCTGATQVTDTFGDFDAAIFDAVTPGRCGGADCKRILFEAGQEWGLDVRTSWNTFPSGPGLVAAWPLTGRITLTDTRDGKCTLAPVTRNGTDPRPAIYPGSHWRYMNIDWASVPAGKIDADENNFHTDFFGHESGSGAACGPGDVLLFNSTAHDACQFFMNSARTGGEISCNPGAGEVASAHWAVVFEECDGGPCSIDGNIVGGNGDTRVGHDNNSGSTTTECNTNLSNPPSGHNFNQGCTGYTWWIEMNDHLAMKGIQMGTPTEGISRLREQIGRNAERQPGYSLWQHNDYNNMNYNGWQYRQGNIDGGTWGLAAEYPREHWYTIFSDNIIRCTNLFPGQGPSHSGSPGICLSFSCTLNNPAIAHNYFTIERNQFLAAEMWNSSQSMIASEGAIRGLTIRNNLMGGGSDTSHVYFYRDGIGNNQCPEYQAGYGDNGWIINNSIYRKDAFSPCSTTGLATSQMVVANNVLWSDAAGAAACQNNSSGASVTTSNADRATGGGAGHVELFASPYTITPPTALNPEQWRRMGGEGKKLEDAGTAVYAMVGDFFNTIRPLGSGIDIGAFEEGEAPITGCFFGGAAMQLWDGMEMILPWRQLEEMRCRLDRPVRLGEE